MKGRHLSIAALAMAIAIANPALAQMVKKSADTAPAPAAAAPASTAPADSPKAEAQPQTRKEKEKKPQVGATPAGTSSMAPASSTAPSVVNRTNLLKDPASKLPPSYRESVVKDYSKPEPQQAVQAPVRPVIQEATAQLGRDLANAKSNADVLKAAAASDLALAKALNQTAILETKSYAFTKRPDAVSALFGSLMRYPGQPAPVGPVQDSIVAPSSIKIRGGAADLDTVNAIADYANMRGEPVVLTIYSRNAQEVMERNNNWKVNMGVQVKRITYKVGDGSVVIDSEAPQSREMAPYTPAQPVQAVAQGSAAPAAPATGAIKPDGNGNWPDLCPQEGFLTKSFCQSQQCKADPSLAGHPICVKFAEKERGN